MPDGLVGAIAIAAGYENSSAIFADGRVIDWGNDTNFMRVPADFHDVVAVAYGYRHRLALRKDGSVVSDGYFFGGIPVPSGVTDVVAISGGEAGASSHFLALRRDGTVVGLGTPGFDDDTALDVPAELTRLSKAVAHAPATPTAPRHPGAIGVHTDLGQRGDDLVLHNGQTPLMYWAAVGDEGKVRHLLEQGADLRAVDDDGDGALRYAMASRNAHLFEMLLTSGSNPNAASTSASGQTGYSILHAVTEMGWVEGLRALVRHGADVNVRSLGGITPMMLAAGAGRDSCVRDLRLHGADMDAVDHDGDSVLYYAASRGHRSTVTLLLTLGVDADPAPSASGYSPLTVAAQMASPLGQRPADIPASDYARITIELIRAGANASAMYAAGFVLYRETSSGGEIAPLARVRKLVADDDHWSVIYQFRHDG